MIARNRLASGFRTLACIGFLMLGFFPVANGLGNQGSHQGGGEEGAKTEKDFTVRVSVEEVRLDAVVVDGRGRQIPDLTAEDFEIFQDDTPQQILSCVYVTDQTAESAKPSLSPKASKGVPPVPMPLLTRESVRRVIAFVVDDLSMSFENIHHARMSLNRFVERQMQPGDLVAILRTSRGISALEMFLSDKIELQSRIDTVRWGENVGRELSRDNLYSYFDGQLSALRYCIRALKDMPGRKALLLMTAQSTIPSGLPNADARDPFDYLLLYQKAYNRLADDAVRAGVVIHTLDIRGLEAPMPMPSLFGGGPTLDQVAARAAEAMDPLPRKTGGLFIKDTNFFVDGIGEVNDALKGYYILSYVPPETTFKPSRKDIYHRIKIKVKRRGATVHTRDGFYGVPETAEKPTPAPNPLREAIVSPFKHNDLKVNLASGYMDGPQAGYLIRSWLHVDAQNVTMIEKEGEGHFVSLETVCVTSDVNGYIRDANVMKYEFRVPDENLAWVRENGIRFTAVLPVKSPGSYYVRVAVKDLASEKVGSARQFVEIPDLKKGRLALSSMFIIGRDDNAAWIRSGVTDDLSQTWVKPVLRRETNKSPALRSFSPGDSFEYMAVVYNAKHGKESAPDLESQFILYKDGLEFLTNESQKFTLTGISNFNRIPIRRRLLLGDALPKGDYALQLLVKDNRKRGKQGTVAQTLTFGISTDEETQEDAQQPPVE
jgi:VWFA-related protein